MRQSTKSRAAARQTATLTIARRQRRDEDAPMRRSRRNRHLRRMTAIALAAIASAAVAAIAFHALADAAEPDTWSGLAVVPEDRCAPYVAAIHMLRPAGPRCSVWC